MTANRSFKQAVRRRMAVTGENYTAARRALEAEGRPAPASTSSRAPAPAPADRELRREALDALRPGTLTAVVSSSGLANLALVAPALAGVLASGGALMHTVDGPAGLHALPNHIDFGLAAGAVTRRDLLAGSSEDRAAAATRTKPLRRHLLALSGRVKLEDVERWARAHAAAGRQGALWVQDLRAGGPLDIGRQHEGLDGELSAQLPLLRRLAVDHGLVVAVALVGGPDAAERWPQLAEQADHLFVGHVSRDDSEARAAWQVSGGGEEARALPGLLRADHWRDELTARHARSGGRADEQRATERSAAADQVGR